MWTIWLTALLGCSERTFVTLTDTLTGDDDDDTEIHTGLQHSGGWVEPPPAAIVVNEIMPGNESTLCPPRSEETPDWVELVNQSDQPFALSRLQLRNKDDEIWVGTDKDGSVLPGEHFLIWLGVGFGDGVWTGFQLDKDKDELVVIVDDQLQEKIPIEGLGGDISWARTPDVTGYFAATAWPTPEHPNPDTVSTTMNVPDATWFIKDQVHQIRFKMSPDAYNEINRPDRPEVHVGMDVDGAVRYSDIGLKLKGSASYNDMSGKPAFIVDMNEWVPGTKFRGLQAFRLHNGNVLDPTRVRDHITYRLAREAGLMAPRVGWAEVWVNEVYYGIYMIIERHDDQLIKYHHPTQEETGVMLEPNEASGFGDFGFGGVETWNMEEGPIPPDPTSQANLEKVDEIIGEPPTNRNVARLWTAMDKELFLTYMAWEAVVDHFDGYKAPNNWRVFVDGENHLVSLVPSGAEWTWDTEVEVFRFNGRAGSWCISNQGCKHDFAEHVLTMADLAETLDLKTDFKDQSMFLDPWIQADPRYHSWETPEEARASTWEHLNTNPENARQQVYSEFPDLRP